jgi:dTDP-4-dehydrorhamnose reductase
MWLFVGGDSQIGSAAYSCCTVPAIATSRRRPPFLDLSDIGDWKPPPGITAACIFAAITSLKACADDPHGTSQVNVWGTVALADKLLWRGIPTLFISSNHVFDGSIPHVPVNSPHSPVSEYGRQKALAERLLMLRMERGLPVGILRLGKVVCGELPILKEWRSGKPILAFSDLHIAPVDIGKVCETIYSLMGKTGIFQLTGRRDESYLDIARRTVHPSLIVESTTIEAGLPAGSGRRYSTLSC